MATSGSELTRIGASLSSVGIKLTITAKAASAGNTVIIFGRGLMRALTRGLS